MFAVRRSILKIFLATMLTAHRIAHLQVHVGDAGDVSSHVLFFGESSQQVVHAENMLTHQVDGIGESTSTFVSFSLGLTRLGHRGSSPLEGARSWW